MPDLSTLTGSELVQELLQAGGGTLDGLEDYEGNDVTDLIVDSGSNSDGYWVKLADGTMICATEQSATVDITASSQVSSGWYRSLLERFDYPQNFDEVYSRLSTGYSSDHRNIQANADGSTSEQNWRIYFMLPESVSDLSVSVQLIAIGKY